LKAGDSGRKPLLPKRTMSFGRSGFSRDPCAIEGGRFGIVRGDFIRGLWDLEGRRFGAKAPPTKRTMCFGRSGFSRDPCAIEGGRFGIVRGGFIRGLWDLEGRGSGLKPLLPKRTMSFCRSRSGFSRDPCVIEDRRFGIAGGAFIRGLWDLEDGKFGAKAPPTKKNDSPSIAPTPYMESRVMRRMTRKPRRTSISIRPSRA
jgi:hypothetical protein